MTEMPCEECADLKRRLAICLGALEAISLIAPTTGGMIIRQRAAEALQRAQPPRKEAQAMACAECERAVKEAAVAYFRWGAATIGLIGCYEHLREVMTVLRRAQRPPDDPPPHPDAFRGFSDAALDKARDDNAEAEQERLRRWDDETEALHRSE